MKQVLRLFSYFPFTQTRQYVLHLNKSFIQLCTSRSCRKHIHIQLCFSNFISADLVKRTGDKVSRQAEGGGGGVLKQVVRVYVCL